VLHTPDGKRIVRFWSYSDEALLLPGLVRLYVREGETKALQEKNKMETLTSVKRGLDLQDYLLIVRQNLSNTRNSKYAADLKERKRM
jgi:hypothetical protein